MSRRDRKEALRGQDDKPDSLAGDLIRKLQPEDAGALVALRREALCQAPLAFASSPDDDIIATVEAARELIARADESAILGAFDGGLVGIVGVYRDRHRKCAHKAHIWGMYVAPERRGEGLGTALLDAALDHARSLHGVSAVHLQVSSAAPEARSLYERAGFAVWGTEPEAIRHDGEAVANYHMVLRLA